MMFLSLGACDGLVQAVVDLLETIKLHRSFKDVQKAAEGKFKALSQAYEAICRERGI